MSEELANSIAKASQKMHANDHRYELATIFKNACRDGRKHYYSSIHPQQKNDFTVVFNEMIAAGYQPMPENAAFIKKLNDHHPQLNTNKEMIWLNEIVCVMKKPLPPS